MSTIHTYLAELKKREEGVQGPTWEINQNHELVSGDRYVLGLRTFEHVDGGNSWPVVRANQDFAASARSDIPELRAIVEVLLEAVEFYAEPDSWRFKEVTEGKFAHSDMETSPTTDDTGEKAQAALTRVGQIVEGKA